MTYLPAPYESVPDDDLGAATAATLAITVGGLLAVTLAGQVIDQIPAVKDTFDLGDESTAGLALLVTTFGWGVAVLFLALGCLLLIFRRGRGALLFGALISVIVTAVARYQFDWFTPVHPLDNSAIYYGGVVVIVFAMLPGTRRWIAGRRHRSRDVPVLTTMTPPPQAQIGRIG